MQNYDITFWQSIQNSDSLVANISDYMGAKLVSISKVYLWECFDIYFVDLRLNGKPRNLQVEKFTQR